MYKVRMRAIWHSAESLNTRNIDCFSLPCLLSSLCCLTAAEISVAEDILILKCGTWKILYVYRDRSKSS